MQSRALQVRHRYLQARRNREYELLREKDKQAAMLASKNVQDVVTIPFNERLNVCDGCNKEFKNNAGLKSHQRGKHCGGDA